jgi:pyruvate dehydrogenase (quinone)
MVDPNIAMLPPHVTTEQAKSFAKSMLHDPDREPAIMQSVKGVIAGIFPAQKSEEMHPAQ